jgi:tetratricopeptide (TPR) repeat protein
MASEHLTPELLDDLFGQRVEPGAFMRLGLRHLLELCPTCVEALRAWKERTSHRPAVPCAPPASAYAPAFERLGSVLRSEAPRIEAERMQAETWLAEFLALPPAARLPAIAAATGRFEGVAFAQRLLRASRKALPDHLEDSFTLAEAAQAALRNAHCARSHLSLFAQALALMGNARRAQGHLREAARFMAAARMLMETCDVADPSITAELDCLEGRLRKDERRFAEAEQLLGRAIDRYRRTGDDLEMARTLVTLGTTYSAEGRPEEAAEILCKALSALDPEQHVELYLFAQYNLACSLHSAGRHRQAWDRLIANQGLFAQHSGPCLRQRMRWLEGRIAAALDDEATAEEAFLAVREDFTRRGFALDVAHVSLDLALLYLRQGRTAELKEIAREIVTLFEAQGVKREALAGALLFRQGAETERLSAAVINRLSRYLEEAKPQPAFRAEWAS